MTHGDLDSHSFLFTHYKLVAIIEPCLIYDAGDFLWRVVLKQTMPVAMRLFGHKREIDSTTVTSQTSGMAMVHAFLLALHDASLETRGVREDVGLVALPVHNMV